MILNDKNAGIFSIKIGVGTYFGQEEEDFYIVLREPTTEEALQFKDIQNKEGAEGELFKSMPNMIIDHNFESAENKKMGKDDVWAEIMKRGACSSHVVNEWANNIPLAKQKLGK